MKTLVLLLALLLAGSSCSKQPQGGPPPAAVALPQRLETYFENYCDYTGSLGIGFVPSHTYDYRLRQHLKATRDPELKRLFVLQHLHEDVEWALRDFEAGVIQTGKTSSRPLTFAEWQGAKKKIQIQIDDLATYSAFTNFATTNYDWMDTPDPTLDSMWIDALRRELKAITNAPAVP